MYLSHLTSFKIIFCLFVYLEQLLYACGLLCMHLLGIFLSLINVENYNFHYFLSLLAIIFLNIISTPISLFSGGDHSYSSLYFKCVYYVSSTYFFFGHPLCPPLTSGSVICITLSSGSLILSSLF